MPNLDLLGSLEADLSRVERECDGLRSVIDLMCRDIESAEADLELCDGEDSLAIADFEWGLETFREELDGYLAELREREARRDDLLRSILDCLEGRNAGR